MDKVVVFGATGRTGRLIVAELLQASYAVAVHCRPDSQSAQDLASAEAKATGKLYVVTGALMDAETLDACLHGSQAVVIAFGPHLTQNKAFCAPATNAIIQAMKAHQISRLVCITGAMIGDYPQNRSPFMRLMRNMFYQRQPELAEDRSEQEYLIMQSGLAWTIVKPPRLNDGEARKHYQADPNLSVSSFSHISRADLAHFVVQSLQNNTFVQQMPVVRY